ncbi:MAG: hypothetical protein HYX67_03805, partial [Candidatus Melainabacteria bacterium]|nr:hypothetical protein [Candidatus Melainabacteria bacterium]
LERPSQNKNSNVASDFVHGFYDTAIQQPIDGVRQLFGAHVDAHDQNESSSIAYKAGGLAGFILDFTALSRLTGGAANRLMGESSTGFFASEAARSATKMSIAGGIYGGVFTPSSESKGLLQGRLEGAAVSGATFATMGGAGKLLEDAKFLGGNQFISRVGSNAIAGGAGGFVSTVGNTYFTEHRMASAPEIASGVGQYALFGAGFGALDFGINKAASSSIVQEKYHSLKWSMQDAAKEAKTKAYGVLNEYDMRHPLSRLGDAVTGSKAVLENQPRPELTAQNNPAIAIERELPKYYDSIDVSEAKIDSLQDRTQKWDALKEQREIRTQFSEKLLKWWHGTDTEPGLKQYTDQELASSGISVERVAEIRKALSTQGRDFSQPLSDLVGRESSEANDLVDGIELAKERFFGYDETALSKKMSMPREHFVKDRDGLAPMSWMPFEPTDKMTNLFHGTVSSSLPGVFTEGGMLPSAEMRLRGITHAGESANEQFPRRAISITRDFNESWAYHRHSPLSLDTYPVVFGISADVMPKVRSAGFIEPGEQLVDRLKLGSSLATTLGLRAPEITHIYVPDAKIPEVNTMLKAYRIKGVSVVGVDELPQPNWKPIPEITNYEQEDEWLRSP